MKKVLLFSLMALSLFGLLGMGGSKEPAPTVAIVKAARLFQECQAGKDGMARLEDLQKQAVAKLETMQGDLQKAQEAKDDAKAAGIQEEMQSLVFSLQNVLKAEQDSVVEKINVAMTKAMDDYRAQSGVLAVFSDEAVLSMDNKVDATNAIMELINKQNVNFGPLPSLEVAKMPSLHEIEQPSKAQDAPAAPAADAAPAPGEGEKPAESAPAPAEKPAQ